jgi:hypothetical protein
VKLSLFSERINRAKGVDDPFSGWELEVFPTFKLDIGSNDRIAVMLETAEWRGLTQELGSRPLSGFREVRMPMNFSPSDQHNRPSLSKWQSESGIETTIGRD